VLSKWQRWWDDFCYELNAEFKRVLALFRRPVTWIAIGALVALLVELYYGMSVALRYDALMHMLGLRTLRCRVLENWQYLMIIYVIFASVVALMYCLGNFVEWVRAREQIRQYPKDAKRLAWKAFFSVIGVGCIGALAIFMLLGWC